MVEQQLQMDLQVLTVILPVDMEAAAVEPAERAEMLQQVPQERLEQAQRLVYQGLQLQERQVALEIVSQVETLLQTNRLIQEMDLLEQYLQ
jgi:hypothetical protein